MKLVRFEKPSSPAQEESWGIQTNDGIRDAGSALNTCPTLLDAIDQWNSISPKLEGLLPDLELLPKETKLLSPVPDAGKVLCIGLNYRDHAIETGADIPTEPVVFNKLQGALCGPDDPIVLPRVSQQVDYEAELVLVIGKRAHHVPQAQAMDHIFGYCCGHDVSARDWQKGRPGGQWILGKSFPNFAPLGPFIATSSEVPDPNNLRVQMHVSGETLQDSTTAQLIFKPDELIAYLSQCFVLEPGDVIFTGTPPGVGAARQPQRFLKPGDVCEVEIEGLGKLKNPVVAEDS